MTFAKTALLSSAAVLALTVASQAQQDIHSEPLTPAAPETNPATTEILEPNRVGQQQAPTTMERSEYVVPVDSAERVLPEGVTPAMVREGQYIFTHVCFRCHTEDGTGSTLAPDLTDDRWLHLEGRNYGEILNLVQTGVPDPKEHPQPMPPKGGVDLSEQQVRAVAAFVFALNKGTD